MTPYIGICDFPSGEQARKSASLFDELCPPTMADWKLMIGVMMSFKTMIGIESRWASVWPKKEDVANIFVEHPRSFNTLHYADYAGLTNLTDLNSAARWGGTNLHALQLDMVWPSEKLVKAFRDANPGVQVVLQVNTNALSMMDDKPQLVVQKLKQYGNSVDCALLDKSHGKGIGLDAAGLLPFARSIIEKVPDMGLSVAGGLGPGTTHLAEPILEFFPYTGIDAQGRLRSGWNSMNPIEWDRADQFLVEAVAMYSRLLKRQ